MKMKTLNDIIEFDIDDKKYLTKSDCEKRKYLKNSLNVCCDVDGDDVYIHNDNIQPPKILKIKRTDEEKRLRRLYGDKGVKFGRGKYLDVTNDLYSNTITTFFNENYVWDRNHKIRELTNREAFRFMDVSEPNIDKMLSIIPKSQCRKLAGNSICVNVLKELFCNLFIENKDNPEVSLF